MDKPDASRPALMTGIMAFGMALIGTRFVKRFAREPGLADELEQWAVEITGQLKNTVPGGWTIEEEADAIGQATREFNENIAQWAAEIRSLNRSEPPPTVG